MGCFETAVFASCEYDMEFSFRALKGDISKKNLNENISGLRKVKKKKTGSEAGFSLIAAAACLLIS